MSTGQPRHYRFGAFEVDTVAGELRRKGQRVRLHPQPFQILCMFLARPGEVVTREEISQALWPDGTFVDFDHGVNAAVNRLREALRDRAGDPHFVETLPRRGYRFVGEVKAMPEAAVPEMAVPQMTAGAYGQAWSEGLQTAVAREGEDAGETIRPTVRWLATRDDLPQMRSEVVRWLFVSLEVMYLAFYVSALANASEVRDLLSALHGGSALFWLVSATAAMLIPVRLFLVCLVFFQPPHGRAQVLRLWPFLLAADMLWALGPFLLLNHVSFGLALACVCPLVYAPFAQRSLVLMGAVRAG